MAGEWLTAAGKGNTVNCDCSNNKLPPVVMFQSIVVFL